MRFFLFYFSLFIFPSFHLLLFLVYLRAVELRCGVYSHPRVSRHDWHVIRPNQKCCPALLTVAPPSTIDPLSPFSCTVKRSRHLCFLLSSCLFYIFFFVLKLNFRFRSWGRSQRRGHVERNVKCFRTGVSRSVCCRISLAYTMWERSPCLTFTPFFNLNCHNDRKDEDSLSLRVQ